MLRRNGRAPQQAADLHQMGTIEAEGLNAVLGRWCFARPLAIDLFDEVIIEVLGAEIDEGDFDASEFRRWPVDAFGFITDVAGPVEVVKIQAQIREF